MVIKKRCLLWDWTNSSGPGNPGVPWAMDQCNFDGPLSSVSNWNTWVPPELKRRAAYRPMVHLEAQLSGQDWDNVLNTDQPIVHFFNEPDKNNISPERAARVWHDQMVPLRQQKGKQLVSPSISSDDIGKNWLADFMSRVADAPPDFYGFFGCMRHLADNFVSPDAQLMQPDGNFTDLMKKLQNEQPMIPPS
ncbi:MAG: hypothetical protein LQ338_007323 [Usnochroma carphineum]|nr:MAG: hypothetical protein LQ338_007323 [Usnochroma carphineum]